MAKMKISGQTQGQLVFAYDIRRGHIDYQKLIPALNKRLVQDGIEAIAEENQLDEVIGEILYRVNEQVFIDMHDILTDKKSSLNINEILDTAIKEVFANEKCKDSI